MNEINLSGTGNFNNFYIAGILKTHRTCQVRGGISSKLTAKCNDDRLKIFTHKKPPSLNVLLLEKSTSENENHRQSQI